MTDHSDDGAKTKMIRGQVTNEARLDLLEKQMVVVATQNIEERERIAALEALQGVKKATNATKPNVWNNTNIRIAIGAALIAFLAFIGWTVRDITQILP